MNGQTIRLVGPAQRKLAHDLIDRAPDGCVVNIAEERRSGAQNARLWASLSDVSRAKPGGRKMTPDRWKMVFMQACGHAVQFEIGLDGAPFPIGYSSSALTKAQFADLLTFIYQWGDEHGVRWSEPNPYAEPLRAD